MDEQVATALDDAFPHRNVDAVNPSGPSWNDENRTVGIDFSDGERVYLKMANDGDGTRIARERAVIAYVGAKSVVPVPTVLASEPERRVPYLVTAPVSGPSLLQSWSDASVSERAELARRVGTALANIHSLRFENHAHIVGGDADGLELEAGPWTDVLAERVTEMREIASSDRFDHRFDDVLEAVEANRDLLDESPAALVHGDPAQPNCFHGEDGIGFLDWEIAHIGDPVRDIERTRNLQIDSLRGDGPEEIVAAFYDGYRERAGGLPDGFEERRRVYDAVRLFGHTGVFDEYVSFLDVPPDELADWMETEMNRRLAVIS
ncbi:phosphotransferase [Haladaptatus sp. DYF46]|uniref:phosphotransferase family protein n=1 Tax=Haladaptatus sp. DYF46 TaxID=2886041 RepID=UPI001E53532E|nr:phosphotransferase [Haladaptatus sp. DYF46]